MNSFCWDYSFLFCFLNLDNSEEMKMNVLSSGVSQRDNFKYIFGGILTFIVIG